MNSKNHFIAAFEALAVECEKHTNPEDIPDRFEEALRLLLDAKQPRADSDEELAEMLQKSMDDPHPGYTMEEVKQHLEASGKIFSRNLENFRTMLTIEAFDSAALMLAPGWQFGTKADWYATGGFHITTSTHGYDEGKYRGCGCSIHHPLSSGGGPKVAAYAPTPALATLAAIMRCYAEWPELWRR